MTPLERLKLAVAVSHTVPGAELRLRTDGGEAIIVSAHPAADIDPCAMRRVVVACSQPPNPDLSAHIVEMELSGAVEDLGGGVFATRRDGPDQRWIPTLLAPRVLASLLDDVGTESVPADAMSATLKPDGDLGVTLLSLVSTSRFFEHALDEVAAAAAAACFVEELTQSTQSARRNQPSAGGQQQ